MSNTGDQTDPRNRRRSQRVALTVPVLVRLEVAEGRHVQAQAFTSVINAHGGLLETPLKLLVNQRITLINPQSGNTADSRVVRVDKPSEGNNTIAFEFDQSNPRFWPIIFPPEDWGVTDEMVR